MSDHFSKQNVFDSYSEKSKPFNPITAEYSEDGDYLVYKQPSPAARLSARANYDMSAGQCIEALASEGMIEYGAKPVLGPHPKGIATVIHVPGHTADRDARMHRALYGRRGPG